MQAKTHLVLTMDNSPQGIAPISGLSMYQYSIVLFQQNLTSEVYARSDSVTTNEICRCAWSLGPFAVLFEFQCFQCPRSLNLWL